MTGHLPCIVCFSCGFGWGYLAEAENLAASSPNRVSIACGGKIEPEQILAAFRDGADGVLLAVCPVGECHFQEGNLQLAKRVALLQEVLKSHGIAAERLRIVADRDPDGSGLVRVVAEFGEQLVLLGPLQGKGERGGE